MLDALKFVQGAVARKDFVPALTHFRIADGRIRGYNGKIALCSPIDLKLEATPRAQQFIKAVQTCKETVQLNLTPAGKLSVKSGSFRAYVECLDDGTFPSIEPEGTTIPLNGEFLKGLKVVAPFIAEDASRPWARGVLFRGPSCFATNNVVLIEYWLGYYFPVDLNVPEEAVNELLRIGEEPISMQITSTSVTFHYQNGRWLKTQTYDTTWPDVSRILDMESTPTAVPQGLFQGVGDLKPFVDELERVFLMGNRIATIPAEGHGASVDVPDLNANGCYNVKQLILIGNVVEKLDLSMFPRPCMFFGHLIRGAILGMRYEV